MEKDPRAAQFKLFSGSANPYAGLTVEIDVRRFNEVVRAKGHSAYLAFYYCAARACNAIPELRRRIRPDGSVVEYDTCLASGTVLLPNGSYGYVNLEAECGFEKFERMHGQR